MNMCTNRTTSESQQTAGAMQEQRGRRCVTHSRDAEAVVDTYGGGALLKPCVSVFDGQDVRGRSEEVANRGFQYLQ